MDNDQNAVRSPCCESGRHQDNIGLAANPFTPNEVLLDLVERGCGSILERIAEHPQASIEILFKLARHEQAPVRAAVVENGNTPLSLLRELTLDESPDVRYAIAQNPNVPVPLLEVLLADENPYVAHRARTTLQRLTAASKLPSSIEPPRSDDNRSAMIG